MPSDEYTTVSGGGALKLKGASVTKKKKKKRTKGNDKSVISDEKAAAILDALADVDSSDITKNKEPKGVDEQAPAKKEPPIFKTETERRHEEAMLNKLIKLASDKSARDNDMFKSHKERVEKLNTYLSKLSEHHDMPKIGPG